MASARQAKASRTRARAPKSRNARAHAAPKPQAHARAAARSGKLTPTESALTEIWRETLDVSELNGSSDFTRLGGDSMAAKRMMARVRERFAVTISLSMLFETPTLESLARRIDLMRMAATRTRAPAAGQWEEGSV